MPGMKAKDLGSSGSYSTDWLCGPELVTALRTMVLLTGKLARGIEGRSMWFTREGAAAWEYCALVSYPLMHIRA